MKRKPAKKQLGDDLFKSTDFFRRFTARGLKDHKYASEFSLDQNKRFSDDPQQERYAIETIKDEEYLVFLLSIVKVAFAVDEAQFFKLTKLNIELRSDSLDSFSRVGSFPVSLAASITLIGAFIALMYFMFPNSIRESIIP